MRCPYFDADECRSCALMGRPHEAQVAGKQARARAAIGADGIEWLPPVVGPESGFRNKAKMVVGGSVDAPTLGILAPTGTGVDLRGCGLYPAALTEAFDPIVDFVSRARLTPYDVRARHGELKLVVVTVSPGDELMIRFVLRSKESVTRIRKHLPTLLDALPRATVVSANIQPEHKAVLEGVEEIVLTSAETLTLRVNELDLHLRPGGFFQTNTEVAAALYRQAREWTEATGAQSVWDLYCGIGGFALHLAAPGRTVTGVEINAPAIEAARRTAGDSGLPGTRFLVGDATEFAVSARQTPDLVVVNPPRRGIGVELAQWLERSTTRAVLYSSCHVDSLAHDLARMPSFRPRSARILDMFPQTGHFEVVMILDRIS